MLNKKEIISIIIITIIIAISISLLDTRKFIITSLSIFVVLMINILAKKIMSFYLDSEIEIKIWEIERFGFKPHHHFKKPLPAGALFPILSKIFLFPIKNFVWMASLVFDVKPKVYRTAKRHGLYSFSEMTEEHIGYIAAAGIVANLFFSIIGYLLGFPIFARLNIYYSFFNIIPISDLDGNKIFFGNKVVWFFLTTVIFFGLLLIIFTI